MFQDSGDILAQEIPMIERSSRLSMTLAGCVPPTFPSTKRRRRLSFQIAKVPRSPRVSSTKKTIRISAVPTYNLGITATQISIGTSHSQGVVHVGTCLFNAVSTEKRSRRTAGFFSIADSDSSPFETEATEHFKTDRIVLAHHLRVSVFSV
ncbi:unnamed protein product, partial [Nesidiocoris tenuis]